MLRTFALLIALALCTAFSHPAAARTHSGSHHSSSHHHVASSLDDYSRPVGSANDPVLSTGWSSGHNGRNTHVRDYYRHTKSGRVIHVHSYYRH